MNVTISVDFGQGYRVALIPADARDLYDQLKPLFEIQPSIGISTGATLWDSLGMTTEKELPVDKMAAELEAKVKAEMDKQGLGSDEVPF